jgi:muramoyltetrapeptide carboxypeptidase
MIIPPYLVPGDGIGLAAPARKVTPEQMAPHLERMRAWGYRVIEAPGLYDAHHQWGGTDEARAAQVNSLIHNPEVKAIWAVRGGYGCVRMMDLVDWDALLAQPKWLVGFSDFTAFHNHAFHLGLATLHAPMPLTFPLTEDSALNNIPGALGMGFQEQRGPVHPNNLPGTAHGRLAGGNLSVLYSMLGSPSLQWDGPVVLFLEDLDEYLYHIDRMMMGLYRSGFLQRVTGLVVGGMTDMHDHAVPFGATAEATLAAMAKTLGIPIGCGFNAGHVPLNQPLVLGTEVTLEVSHTGSRLYA